MVALSLVAGKPIAAKCYDLETNAIGMNQDPAVNGLEIDLPPSYVNS